MATYNCADSQSSAYGEGNFGTCSTQVGTPNTGVFQQVVTSGSFSIIAPLVGAIIIVVVAMAIDRRRKRARA